MSTPECIKIINQLKAILEGISSENGYNSDLESQVYFMRQWFDVRNYEQPWLSFFVLDESLVENKGCSYKQELNFKVEVYADNKLPEDMLNLVSDVKRALLLADNYLSIIYIGYEINLPEEGSSIMSAIINFKINYVENIK